MRTKIYLNLILLIVLVSCKPKQKLSVFDMVHHNPGEAPFATSYNEPEKYIEYGYSGKVFHLFDAGQYGVTFDTYDNTLFQNNSEAKNWIEKKEFEISKKYSQFSKEGLEVYCMMDMIVLPKQIVEKHKNEVCNKEGKIDIHKPKTQEIIRTLINEIFIKFPELNGLVIRTGETYLNDAPYHQGNNPITRGAESHVLLLNILREEVCVKRNKKLYYRTWDTELFHSIPRNYLDVVDKIEPHKNLFFSIKHTIVDFWRSAPIDWNEKILDTIPKFWIDEATKYGIPFNPALGKGKHKQIVEIQCQREYEGKGAHPNYIANGVINRFTELKGLSGTQSLNELVKKSNFSGIWTWSRGGGWGGPYIKNDIWNDANTFVLAAWANNPSRNEKEIFKEFAKSKGFKGSDIDKLHQICLLSTDAILHSQYSEFGHVNVVWTRDQNIGGSNILKSTFDYIYSKNMIKEYLDEKKQGTQLWQKIEKLGNELNSSDKSLQTYIATSCTYGRIKHELFEKIWIILLNGYVGDKTGNYNISVMEKSIKEYYNLWDEWKELSKKPECPTIYKDVYGLWCPGAGPTIKKYEEKITNIKSKS